MDRLTDRIDSDSHAEIVRLLIPADIRDFARTRIAEETRRVQADHHNRVDAEGYAAYAKGLSVDTPWTHLVGVHDAINPWSPVVTPEECQIIPDLFPVMMVRNRIEDLCKLQLIGADERKEIVTCLAKVRHEAAQAPASEANGSPAAGSAEIEPQQTEAEKIANLQPAVQIAWAGWCAAEVSFQKTPEDREAWDWIREQEHLPEPPAFATWSKQVRTARKALGRQKNTSREGREGRSVVKANQL